MKPIKSVSIFDLFVVSIKNDLKKLSWNLQNFRLDNKQKNSAVKYVKFAISQFMLNTYTIAIVIAIVAKQKQSNKYR